MDDVLARFWWDLVGRLSGPLTVRLYLQPVMASFFGVRDELKDARERRTPYFRTLLTQPAQRRALSAEGFTSIGKIIVLAIVLDVIDELIVFRRLRAVETIDVATFSPSFHTSWSAHREPNRAVPRQESVVEELFLAFARSAARLVEAMAVAIVAFGALEAFVRLGRIVVRPGLRMGNARKSGAASVPGWCSALSSRSPPISSPASSHPPGKTLVNWARLRRSGRS
jgi:hypothetical protein